MTITPVKFTVKHSVLVEGHKVDDGIYVGQKISDTEIERQHRRKHSFFLHIVEPAPERTSKVAERFDLDVTPLVSTGAITVS
jgi:ribosomal protein L44E